MLKDLDTDAKGQQDLFDENLPGELFAVSKIFAEAKKQMTIAEYKCLAYALSHVQWKADCPDTIYCDKKELAAAVGIQSDPDHLSVHLFESIGDMPKHSFLKFADKDKDIYESGNFVRRVTMLQGRVRIKLESDYLSLFGNLDSGYITMWSGDIYKMRTARSVALYELLRDSMRGSGEQVAEVGVRRLKELFDIPKDGEGSYMTKAGHFDRPHFEQRVLEPALEDISKSDMIHITVQPDGKLYEKLKAGSRVQGYKIVYSVSLRPKVATATEVQQIQERVDKNPELLKVAKDILKGEKKPKKQQPSNNFLTNYTQREYVDSDFEDIEEMLMNKGKEQKS